MSRYTIVKPVKLDAKDRKIITALNENARLNLSKLKINLSNDAIKYRIDRLIKRGVISQFTPRINVRRFGYVRFHLFFLLEESRKAEQENLIEYLKAHPNIRSVIQYSAGWDLEIVIVATTVKEFDDILRDISGKFSQLILDKNELVIVKNYSSAHLPYEFYKHEPTPRLILPEDEEKFVKLDKTDLNVLSELTDNARLSTYKIADKVRVSKDTVRARMKAMEKNGAITSYTTIFNLAALGYSWYTCLLSIKTMDSVQESRFMAYVNAQPYIIRAVKVFGSWDLLLYIAAPTPKAFHQTMSELKQQFSTTITRYEALIVYKEHIYNPLPSALLNP